MADDGGRTWASGQGSPSSSLGVMKEMLGGLRRAQGGSEVDALVRAPCLSDAYNYPSAAEPDPDDGGFFAGAEEEDEVTDDLLAALEEQARIAVANELRVRVPSPPPMGRMGSSTLDLSLALARCQNLVVQRARGTARRPGNLPGEARVLLMVIEAHGCGVRRPGRASERATVGLRANN